MDWLYELLFGTGVAHVVFVLALTMALGVLAERIRICGISLGTTWILFSGILLSQLGMRIQPEVESFIKQFGLILFIYSIGLQVGPGFFSSLKKGGLQKNLFMLVLVFSGIAITYAITAITSTPMTTMIGIMSGAVISTPSLGAAEQTLYEMTGTVDQSMAQGYAVAYPFAVVLPVIFLSIMKSLMKIDHEKEKHRMLTDNRTEVADVEHISLIVEKQSLSGLSVGEITKRFPFKFVVSRIRHADGSIESVSQNTQVVVGDRLFVIVNVNYGKILTDAIGSTIAMSSGEWGHGDEAISSRTVIVTKSGIHGRTLGQLKLRNHYNVTVTRVYRSGVDLLATPDLILQIGDRLMLVGSDSSMDDVASFLGNSDDKLLVPHIIPIFVGIFLGVLVGSIPIFFPFMPQPIKLGLTGGPLIIAILLGRFGPNLRIVTYTTRSANMMLREIGLSMFMAAVGLSSGSDFASSIVSGGYIWILYGVVITMVPLLITVFVIRYLFRKDFYTMSGILAGAFTSPVLLAYVSQQASSDIPSVNYATVYPLATFIRILAGQTMILLAI